MPIFRWAYYTIASPTASDIERAKRASIVKVATIKPAILSEAKNLVYWEIPFARLRVTMKRP